MHIFFHEDTVLYCMCWSTLACRPQTSGHSSILGKVVTGAVLGAETSVVIGAWLPGIQDLRLALQVWLSSMVRTYVNKYTTYKQHCSFVGVSRWSRNLHFVTLSKA